MHALTRIRQIQSDMAALSNALRPQVFGSHLATATRTLDQAVGVSSGGFGTGDSPVAFGDLPLRQFPRWNPRMDSLGAPTSPLSIPEEVSLPTRADRWLGEIEAAANRHGVSPTLLTALVWSESAFNPDAVSSAGAIGLAQLMPGTAAGMNVDPHDPVQNLDGGARYLAAQLVRFGSEELALAAYNAGPGRVGRSGGIPNIPETQNYVQIVMRRYRQLEGDNA